jgi:hypothetical protein
MLGGETLKSNREKILGFGSTPRPPSFLRFRCQQPEPTRTLPPRLTRNSDAASNEFWRGPCGTRFAVATCAQRCCNGASFGPQEINWGARFN